MEGVQVLNERVMTIEVNLDLRGFSQKYQKWIYQVLEINSSLMERKKLHNVKDFSASRKTHAILFI